MTLTEIKNVLAEAEQRAGAIARTRPESDHDDLRILAIAIAETARAVRALVK